MISLINTDLAKREGKTPNKQTDKQKTPKNCILQVNKKAFCSDVKNVF